MITHIRVSGEARPGCEFGYYLAIKHRDVAARLCRDTPWWQWRKRKRREQAWSRAWRRFHENGRDVVVNYRNPLAAS